MEDMHTKWLISEDQLSPENCIDYLSNLSPDELAQWVTTGYHTYDGVQRAAAIAAEQTTAAHSLNDIEAANAYKHAGKAISLRLDRCWDALGDSSVHRY